MSQETKTRENKKAKTFSLAIDHGNRLIKTVSSSFNAGLIEVSYLPSMGADVLNYKDKSYTLSSKSQSILIDKSLDDRYFILSLFAIAKEAKACGFVEGEVNDLELLVGLPLQHYQAYKKKLEAYFFGARDRSLLDEQN